LVRDWGRKAQAEKKVIGEVALTPEGLAELLALIEDGTISGKIGKEILPQLMEEGGSPKKIVEDKGLVQVCALLLPLHTLTGGDENSGRADGCLVVA